MGEVAETLDLPAHVLRFWESKFPQLRPLKRGGGRRYYRPQEIDLLRQIRQCLYHQGYTIRGVQKLLRDGALLADAPQPPPAREAEKPPSVVQVLGPATDPPATATGPLPSGQTLRETLEEVRRELLDIRMLLNKLI
ncbi:MAG TPA: MerR family transcriptional regulator [Stellaceae bacterium]